MFVVRSIGFRNRLFRLCWNVVYYLLFRFTPTFLFSWRNFVLSCFGARLGSGVKIYPSVKIWAPWNLVIEDFSTLAPYVECYSVDTISIGRCTTVSQYSFLCTASHNYQNLYKSDDGVMPLLSSPIDIGSYVWITSYVFVGPGVVIGNGVVATARSVVVDSVPENSIIGGNPAKLLKVRAASQILSSIK